MRRCSFLATVFSVALVSSPLPAASHPLGNFSIDHYSHLTVTPDALRVLYIIDMAEIPAFQELARLDADGNGQFSDSEVNAFVERKRGELVAGLIVALNGQMLTWRIESSDYSPTGSGVLPTMRIVMHLIAELPQNRCRRCAMRYEDLNFPERSGWKEIIVDGTEGVRVIESSAPAHDVSRQLTRYPPEIVPPQVLRADLAFDLSGAVGPLAPFRRALRRPEYAWVAVASALLILLVRWRTSQRGTTDGRTH